MFTAQPKRQGKSARVCCSTFNGHAWKYRSQASWLTPDWMIWHPFRSEAEASRASCGASSREKRGLEQEVANARACEAALSAQVGIVQLEVTCRVRS